MVGMGIGRYAAVAAAAVAPQPHTTQRLTLDSTNHATTNPPQTPTVPAEFGSLLYLAVPCFVLAVIFHPGAHTT